MRNSIETSFKLKSADETGRITGYASVFSVEDRHGESVAKGAFVKTIMDAGGRFPLLWSHEPGSAIGAVTDLREDAKGLYFEGQLNPESGRFKELLWLLREKAVRGVSIGFQPIRERIEKGIRVFTEVRLIELSLVVSPACPGAEVTSLKSEESSELAEAIRQFVDACKK